MIVEARCTYGVDCEIHTDATHLTEKPSTAPADTLMAKIDAAEQERAQAYRDAAARHNDDIKDAMRRYRDDLVNIERVYRLRLGLPDTGEV